MSESATLGVFTTPSPRIAVALPMDPFAEGGSSPVPEIASVINSFESVSLEELGKAALMDRVDTKFLVPTCVVPEILEQCAEHYCSLEVSGKRLSRYDTRYFDTPDLQFYHAHHGGRSPRHKVRVRTYLDTGSRFLEVKLKNNKGRTRKARVFLTPDSLDVAERLKRDSLLGITRAVSPADLRESLEVDYTRVTLVGKEIPERITLDLVLTFSHDGKLRSYPDVVILELKQEHRDRSYFLDAIRARGIREATSLSKYCLGIANLEPRAKKNRFKTALRHLEKVNGGSRVALHACAAI